MAIEESDFLAFDESATNKMEDLLSGDRRDRDTAEDAEAENPLTDL